MNYPELIKNGIKLSTSKKYFDDCITQEITTIKEYLNSIAKSDLNFDIKCFQIANQYQVVFQICKYSAIKDTLHAFVFTVTDGNVNLTQMKGPRVSAFDSCHPYSVDTFRMFMSLFLQTAEFGNFVRTSVNIE